MGRGGVGRGGWVGCRSSRQHKKSQTQTPGENHQRAFGLLLSISAASQTTIISVTTSTCPCASVASAHTRAHVRQNKGERRKRGAVGLGVGEGWAKEGGREGGGEGVANKRGDCMIRGSRGGEGERERESE